MHVDARLHLTVPTLESQPAAPVKWQDRRPSTASLSANPLHTLRQVRVALHTARELAASLDVGAAPMDVDTTAEGGSEGGGVDARLEAYDKVINALAEARAAARALAKANAGKCTWQPHRSCIPTLSRWAVGRARDGQARSWRAYTTSFT